MARLENLVFSGGGIRGIGFVGAVEYLESVGALRDLRCAVGTSVGSMIATFVACRVSATDMRRVVLDMDFSKFRDGRYWILGEALGLYRRYGAYLGDALFQWVGVQLKRFVGDADVTFRQIYDRTGVDLIITGTSLKYRRTNFYRQSTNPDMPVRKAIRISVSIPLLFEPIVEDGDTLVDGGVLCNFPIRVLPSDFVTVSRTLALEIESESVSDGHSIDGLPSFIASLIDSMLMQIERDSISHEIRQRTVKIPSLGISTAQFTITVAQKEALLSAGYQQCRTFMTVPPSLLFLCQGAVIEGCLRGWLERPRVRDRLPYDLWYERIQPYVAVSAPCETGGAD